MNRFDQLDIRNRPVITALFYYSDAFIDPALRFYGDIQKALFLYLKHEGYENIVFHSLEYGPNSFDGQMLFNFLNPSHTDIRFDSIPTNNTPASIPKPSESTRNDPFRRASHHSKGNEERIELFPVVLDKRGFYTRPGNASTQNRGREYGNRDANILQLCNSLDNLSNSVLVIEANSLEAECENSTCGILYKRLCGHSSLQSNYTECPSPSKENRVIVLMSTDNPNVNAVSDLFKDHDIKSIFLNNRDFRNLWRETMPSIEGIAVPKDNVGESIKILSPKNSFMLPAPQQNDIKHLIEMGHLQYPDVRIEWNYLDDLTKQLSVLATVVGNSQHTLKSHKELVYSAFEKGEPVGYSTFQQMATTKMKLGPKDTQKLDALIGLQSVKDTINRIKADIWSDMEQGIDTVGEFGNHMMFLGNPGTGKTTVARIVAEIMKDLGVVNKGQLIEVNAENLRAGYVGQTAIKTSEVIDSAMDGVLFVDEAYRLADDEFGIEAVNTLLARMENDRDRLVVIFAGYEENMKSLYRINPGLKRRIRHFVLFDDYSAVELKQIFMSMAEKFSVVISGEVDQMLADMMEYAVENKNRRTDEVRAINAQRVNDNNPDRHHVKEMEVYNFGNGGWVRNVLGEVKSNANHRRTKDPNADSKTLIFDDFRNLSTKFEELVGFVPGKTKAKQKDERSASEQLEKLVGVQSVKDYVQRLKNDAEFLRQTGEETNLGTQHLLLYGNPGTGKTTVAHLLAGIYYELGLLSRRHIVEVKREHLVVGFQGQTAPNVAQRMQAAKGGVLFIDEAYSLYRGKEDIFGIEAIDTLVSYLENNRNDIVVIMAGYEDRMQKLLTEVNGGLLGRFGNNIITMADYSKEELYQIAISDIENRGYVLNEEAKTELKEYVTPNKDNARWVRNLVDKIDSAHRTHCVENANYSNQISIGDIKGGISLMENTQIK